MRMSTYPTRFTRDGTKIIKNARKHCQILLGQKTIMNLN